MATTSNPVLDEIERWQSIYDWFREHPDWDDELAKVEDFLRHMIASTNIAPQPSNPSQDLNS